jgi:hypothetical protein
MSDANGTRAMTGCYACRQNRKTPSELPPRELVFDDGN